MLLIVPEKKTFIYFLELESSTQNENVMEGNALPKQPTGEVSEMYEDCFKVIIFLERYLQ